MKELTVLFTRINSSKTINTAHFVELMGENQAIGELT
jgi:hypothetical protein